MKTKHKGLLVRNPVTKENLRVYPISVLAENLSRALNTPRSAQTVRKWEAKGILPPAIFRVSQKRVYTEEQIDVICKTAKKCNIMQGASIIDSLFPIKVKEALLEVNKKYIE